MFANETHEKAHNTLKEGKINEAIKLYTEALKVSPSHPDIISDRGVAYLHLENKELCYQDFQLALELQPQKAYRYTSFAFAMNHFGDIEGAIRQYEKAIELDPDDAVAHNNLGLLLEQKGYKDEAQVKFDRADKLSKLEDEFLEMLDKMDGTEGNAAERVPNTNTGIKGEEEKQTVASEMIKVLTNKESFREFVKYIKNGFKIQK